MKYQKQDSIVQTDAYIGSNVRMHTKHKMHHPFIAQLSAVDDARRYAFNLSAVFVRAG
jgi:hypothetical protein